MSDSADDCGQAKKVPELLAEQIEAANVILLNKKDLAGQEQVQVASSLAQSLNDKAKIVAVEYGKVQPSDILKDSAIQETSSCCSSAEADGLKELAVEEASSCCSSAKAEIEPVVEEPQSTSSCCASKEKTVEKLTSSCCDKVEGKKGSSCCDESASQEGSSCCDHSAKETKESDGNACLVSKINNNNKIGVTSFVYKADRPFSTKKILSLLDQWPVPIKDELDLSLLQEVEEGDYEVQSKDQKASPFLGVLRSKGLCWFAPTRWRGRNEDTWRHNTAMFWSHAGKQFGITKIGQWWGSISGEEMKERLAGEPEEYNRILKEDFVTEEFADRRQEIVFIGIGMDEQEIRRSLDDCLVKDKGMKRYREYLSDMQEDGFL